MRALLIICLLFLMRLNSPAQQWESALIKVNNDGSLKYIADKKGNIIPDFSGVGYHHNRKDIPMVDVVKTVQPSDNDQQTIQKAIDEVSKRPVDANGFRGAILLTKGTYKIPGSLRITTGGIVLRGEGMATKLIATGKGQRKLLIVSGTGSAKEVPGTRRKIANDYVPVGTRTLRIENIKDFGVGDNIILLRPGTTNWIMDLKMDQITPGTGTIQWTPEAYDLTFERQVDFIRGSILMIDEPVVMEMDQKYGGGYIYKYTFEGRIAEVGVEDLYLESEFAKADDEDHGWDAVSFNRVENGWIRNVTAKYFGYSCVNLGAQSKQVTVVNCKALEPKSQVTGGRRYSFNNDGQLNLFIDCYAYDGRHDFVTGAKVAGPNVFFNGVAEHTNADIGPHHRWAMGTLYDNINSDGEINAQDRGNWGTGHGWSGVTQVFWNNSASRSAIQNPWVSGNNYAIGMATTKYDGRLAGRPDAVWEGLGEPGINPGSLYLAQVRDSRRYAPDDKWTVEVKKVLKEHILKEAAWALKQQPITVTATIATRSAGGKHDFYSEGDYWWPDSTGAEKPYIQRDGMTNPANFTAHREAMIRFSRIVGALASAYKLTGDKKYVLHALKHCKAWFSDPDTRMNPSLLYAQAIKGRATGRGIGIIDTIQLMEVVQGLLAMQQSGAIVKSDWQEFQYWFAEYLQWLTTHPYGKEEMEAKNNHGTCWVMQVAVFAKFTQNMQLLNFCKERFRTVLLPAQMAEDGSFPLEIKRTKPYGYSIFNLDAMATICQALSTPAEDLWNYTVAGRSVKKGIDFLYPFVKDKTAWPFAKDVMYWESWPVAQPAFVFAAIKTNNEQWFDTWSKLDHDPQENEVIRNLPVKNPLIWLN